jgi:hypothetical protein
MFIRGINASTGAIAGGTAITALMKNAGVATGTVEIGTTGDWTVCPIVSWNDTYINFTTPARAAGTVSLRITTAGLLTDTLTDCYTYIDYVQPVVTVITPEPISPVDQSPVLERVQGGDPHVMLTWSDDGGFTWGGEYWHGAGRVGAHLERVHWHRLGTSRDRVFRMVITDPVKVVLIAAQADIDTE